MKQKNTNSPFFKTNKKKTQDDFFENKIIKSLKILNLIFIKIKNKSLHNLKIQKTIFFTYIYLIYQLHFKIFGHKKRLT